MSSEERRGITPDSPTPSSRKKALRPETRSGGSGTGEGSFWQALNGTAGVARVGIRIKDSILDIPGTQKDVERPFGLKSVEANEPRVLDGGWVAVL
jgi:hypothetical protein